MSPGHETTASLLNWMWYLLATHPEAPTKLGVEFDELPWEGNYAVDMLQNYTYARKVISEALRLYPPLWLMSRKSLKDDSLGEYVVQQEPKYTSRRTLSNQSTAVGFAGSI